MLHLPYLSKCCPKLCKSRVAVVHINSHTCIRDRGSDLYVGIPIEMVLWEALSKERANAIVLTPT